MAKVTAPFLSLAARGGIAETLQAYRWKNIQVMRKWQGEIQRPSSAQLLQQTTIRTAVAAWKAIIKGTTRQTWWERAARRHATHESAWSMWIKSAPYTLNAVPDPIYLYAVQLDAHATILLKFMGIASLTETDEPGNCYIYAGHKRTPLNLLAVKETSGSNITIDNAGTPGDTLEVQVIKDGYDRSGVFTVTLIP
jgi:hypothetical protein